MPTLPPHQHRQVAESFGTDAERYDRARPRYPQALIDRVVAALPGPDVLDVGIGSGIAARQFRAAGCRVTGVEPDARMAGLARQHGLEVEVATFEAWEPAGRTFDGVVAAQAWHWVDPAADAIRAAAGFGEPEQWQVDWERVYTRDEWLEVMPTQGGFGQLPPATAAELLTGVGAAIDELGGSFTVRYAAVALTAARAPLTA